MKTKEEIEQFIKSLSWMEIQDLAEVLMNGVDLRGMSDDKVMCDFGNGIAIERI